VGTAPVPGAWTLVLLGGVVMLIEWSVSGRDPFTVSMEPQLRLSDLLTRGLVWSPTRELAEEATTQLRSVSSERTVMTSQKYRELGIERREMTWHGENWMRPIRAWYADETAGVDNRNAMGTDAVVLEIGLLNYGWLNELLSIQVMMRLVDVQTDV
jgi:hypothetical protein